jgi:proteasome accessory factor A
MANGIIIGTETEYGIISRRPGGFDPLTNSILLVNSFPVPYKDVIWDYAEESPLFDIRGFKVEGDMDVPDEEENRSINRILPNGGRLYVDAAHPEYSTPECVDALELVRYESAGEQIVARSSEEAGKVTSRELILYKNNIDSHGTSYGYHENYLVSRSIPFERIVDFLTPFLVTRQIYCGSGKVHLRGSDPDHPFQIAQRADLIEKRVGLETMDRRPIINTRDEPHADRERYRRLHVIVGDANMSQFSTYLKTGAMSLVLGVLEEGGEIGLELEDPVRAIRRISMDPACRVRVKLTDGRELTAVEIQREYLDRVEGLYAGERRDRVTDDLIRRWGYVLDVLADDPMGLEHEVDWVIKKSLLERYMRRKGVSWDDEKISLMDLQYHDLSEEKGLFRRLVRKGWVEPLVPGEAVTDAMADPPEGTRAWFRGMCLKKYPHRIFGGSWTSILFSMDEKTIKRVPMMEPLRGNRELTEDLFARSETVEELLVNLGS